MFHDNNVANQLQKCNPSKNFDIPFVYFKKGTTSDFLQLSPEGFVLFSTQTLPFSNIPLDNSQHKGLFTKTKKDVLQVLTITEAAALYELIGKNSQAVSLYKCASTKILGIYEMIKQGAPAKSQYFLALANWAKMQFEKLFQKLQRLLEQPVQHCYEHPLLLEFAEKLIAQIGVETMSGKEYLTSPMRERVLQICNYLQENCSSSVPSSVLQNCKLSATSLNV